MDTLQAAIAYRARGLSVIPLHPGRKKSIPNWKIYQNRLPTEMELHRWWHETPGANVGVVTGIGSGLVVVDVDTYKGGSIEGLPLTGVIQRTGRGGLQYFYKHPGDRMLKGGGGIRPGIDIRADGNYICIAPSDTTGNPDNEGEGGPYTWVSEDWDALGDAPDWALIDADAEPEHDADAPKEKWIERILSGDVSHEGGRNNALTRLAGYYASLGMPLDVMLALCRDWSENKLAQPIEDDGELYTTVRQQYKTERKKHPERYRKTVSAASELLAITPLAEYMEKHGGALTQWTIKNWLPDATIAFLISPPQSYKTYTTFDLAVSVASGSPFLGQFPVHNPGPVLIFQQEDPHNNIAERTALIASERLTLDPMCVDDDGTVTVPFVQPEQLPIYYHEDRKLRFDEPEMMDALEVLVERIKPRMVIVDPLYSAVGSEEYMQRAAQQMLRLKDIRDKHGCSFIIVHHTAKALQSWDRQGVWGSQFLNAFMETSWLMRKPLRENSVVVLRHFKVAGQEKFVRLSYDIQDKELPAHYHVACVEISDQEANKLVQAEVAVAHEPRVSEAPDKLEKRLLKTLADWGPLELDTLAARLDVAVEDIDPMIEALQRKHKVTQDDAGKWSIGK